MLDIRHTSDWSNSAKRFNGKTAVKIQFDETDEPFSGFLRISSQI